MSKKKKAIATAAAVALAAIVALGGGTLAYFTWTSDEVENVVANNYNWVGISEAGAEQLEDEEGNPTDVWENDSYEIIPGTSQEKKPIVTASYSLDSYVFVEVTDTSDGLINWETADGWKVLTETENADGDVIYGLYYKLLTTDSKKTGTVEGVDYWITSLEVLDGNSISYSSSITNDESRISVDGTGTPNVNVSDYSLNFQAYIIQADITGDSSSGSSAVESALACWNALNASTSTSSVNAGNVAVETDNGATITSSELVVTSTDGAYSAIVPAGVTIDTDTADIVTTTNAEGKETITTTLILVVEEVGENYTSDDITVKLENGQIATVYDISIIGVSEKNETVMEIAVNIGTGFENVSVEHESEVMAALTGRAESGYTNQTYYYNSTTGILYIYTKTFSEFAVKYDAVAKVGDVTYTTLEAALNAAGDGETVMLLADIKAASAVIYSDSSKSVTLDLNGHTITNSSTSESSVLTVSGGSLTVTDSGTSGAITGDTTITKVNQVGILVSGGTLTVSGGTVSGYAGILVSGGTLNVIGGTVKGLSEAYDTMTVYFTGEGSNVAAYKDQLSSTESAYAVNGSGIIAVAGYDPDLAVNISGGTITAENHYDNYDICVVQVTDQDEDDYGVDITVTGGTFGGDAGEFENIYLACDWGYTGDEYAEGAYEYSWITLTDNSYLLGGTVGKYYSKGWSIGVNGFSPF